MLDGCRACYSEADLELLAGDPAAVPPDLIGSFAREPHDHWSPEAWRFGWQSFGHRILGMVVGRDLDPGLSLRGLGRWCADLAAWPPDERAAMDAALGELLTTAARTWRTDELPELLGGLASVYDDLRPWLARLSLDDAGVVRLAFRWSVDLLWDDTDWFGWWWPEDDPVPLVREWVLSPEVRGRVEQFAAAHPTCKTARDTLIACDRLDRGERSPWFYPGVGYPQLGRLCWLIPV